MKRKLFCVTVIALCLLDPVYAQSQNPPAEQPAAGSPEIVGRFIGYVVGEANKLPWPQNPRVFGWDGSGGAGEVLEVYSWSLQANGDTDRKVLASLPSQNLTPENYRQDGDRFIAVLTAFLNDRREAARRGELRSLDSFIAELSDEESVFLERLLPVVHSLYQDYLGPIHSANPAFAPAFVSVSRYHALFDNKRVIYFTAVIIGDDGVADEYKVVEYPIDRIGKMSDKELQEAVVDLFEKVQKKVQEKSKQ